MNKPEALRLAEYCEDFADEIDLTHFTQGLRESATELRRLHEANEALQADAERYRYLRNRDPQEILAVIGPAAGVWIDCEEANGDLTLLTGEDADAAIDAEMRKK